MITYIIGAVLYFGVLFMLYGIGFFVREIGQETKICSCTFVGYIYLFLFIRVDLWNTFGAVFIIGILVVCLIGRGFIDIINGHSKVVKGAAE